MLDLYTMSHPSLCYQDTLQDFPGGPVVRNSPANARDTSSTPGLGRFHVSQGNSAGQLQPLKLAARARALQREAAH